MPKVFSGKVIVPFNQINEYLKSAEDFEESRKSFRDKLESINANFYDYLLNKYTNKTARKHYSIIEMFLEFITYYTDIESLEDVTKGIANSYFKKWYKKKVWDSSTDTDLKVAVKKFFLYLKNELKIENEAVLKSL